MVADPCPASDRERIRSLFPDRRISAALLEAWDAAGHHIAGCLPTDAPNVLTLGPEAVALRFAGGIESEFLAVAHGHDPSPAQVFDAYAPALREVAVADSLQWLGPRRNAGDGDSQFFYSTRSGCRAAFRHGYTPQPELLDHLTTRAVVQFAIEHRLVVSRIAVQRGELGGITIDLTPPGAIAVERSLVIQTSDVSDRSLEVTDRRGHGLPLTSEQLDDRSVDDCASLDRSYGALAHDACLSNEHADPQDCEVFRI